MDCENIKINYLNSCINSEIKSTTADDKNKKTKFKNSRDCAELKKYYDLYCNNRIIMSSPSER